MNEPFEKLKEDLRRSSASDQKEIFLEYCQKLIDLKESGELTEENVGSDIVSAMLLPDLIENPEYEAIFDIASDMEISRESSFRQGIGNWDAKAADGIKRDEWEQFVAAVSFAGKGFAAGK